MKYYVILCLALLVSCASKNSFKKELIVDPQKAMRTWCWSGEGKGRIIQNGESYRLSFEDKKIPQGWLLSLDHPFRGEEIFKFDWSNSKDVRLSANFPREFDPALLKKFKLSSEQIWQMINNWGEIVRWIQETPFKGCTEIKTNSYICPFALELTIYEGRWQLEQKSFNGERIIFSGDDSNLFLQLQSSKGQPFFSLDLIYSECQNT